MHPLRAAAAGSDDYGARGLRRDSSISVSAPPASSASGGSGDYVPEDVSYERDFAPLAQQYFRSAHGGGMSSRAASTAFNSAADRLEQAYMGRAAIRSVDEQSRNRRVDYEQSVFALESARETARKEREMLNGIAPIQDELLSITQDPEATAAQRRRALGAFGVKNAALLGTNKIADGMYRSALNSAVDDKDDRSKYTVKDWYSASRGIDDGYLKEVETRLGRPLQMDDELPLGEVMPRLSKLNKKMMEDKDKADREEKSTAFRERQREETFTRVNRIELVPGESVLDEKTGKVAPAPSKLKDPSDDIVLDSVVTHAGTPEERAAYPNLSLDDKLRLAKKIQVEIGLGKRNAAGAPARPTKADDISGLAPRKPE